MTALELRRIIKADIVTFGGVRALGRKIGVAPSAISHVMKGGEAGPTLLAYYKLRKDVRIERHVTYVSA